MEAFLPALVAALLAGVGDRPVWLAAVLVDRLRRPALVLAGTLAAQILVNGIAVAGGLLVAPILTPNARAILLGAALCFAGGSALLRPRLKDRLENWTLSPFLVAFLGSFSLALGDRTAFITFALAARSDHGWSAGAGAVIGCLVLATIATTLGERAWRDLPLRALSVAAGTLLLLAGFASLLSGLRLI